ncbi:MAG: enoyl-CoA hydratase/isomerase family protein [Anaerolineales bacterium]|nr:enoyl-CoA hydratase/isomerase family protein [Anaerolineales bacterium]
MSQPLILVEIDSSVALVTLNRPDALNALSPEMLGSLAETLENLDRDESVRVMVLSGGQSVFAAGADIKAMASASPVDIYLRNTRQLWQRLWALDKPLIAAVNGVAFGGGCELALGCDLIVAGEGARFGQPEIKLGIMPGAGGSQRLAKALGPYRAMEMVLTGDPLSAPEAHAAGLVNRLVADDQVLAAARELAAKIAERPAVAVRLARQALRYGVEHSLREGLEMERRNYRLLYDTADQKEGMAAFIEKRKAKFKGG